MTYIERLVRYMNSKQGIFMKQKIAFRWKFYYALARIFVFFTGNFEVIHKNTIDTSRPFILLGNHTCFFDFLFAMYAVGPCPMRFLVARKYFLNPLFNAVLLFFGCIPKSLASDDSSSTKTMFSALRNRENLAIYPEGQVAMWGKTEPMNPSIAKLIKKTGYNVIFIRDIGSYFAYPPYGSSFKRGKIIAEVSYVSVEEIKAMNESEVFAKIEESLSFDQYALREKNNLTYAGTDNIEAFKNMIYRCPSCMSLCSITADNNKLICSHCSLEGIVSNASIDWSKQDIPCSLSGLYSHFIAYEKAQKIKKLSANCTVIATDLLLNKDIVHEDIFVTVDSDTIQMDGKTLTISIPRTSVDFFPHDVGDNFQIYTANILYVVKPHQKQLPTAFATLFRAF